MCLHNLIHDGQPQPGTPTAVFAVRPRFFQTVESFEDSRNFFLRYAQAGVDDHSLDPVTGWPCDQAHSAAVRGMPERIVGQIGKHLNQPIRVAQDRPRLVKLKVKFDAPVAGTRQLALIDIGEDGVEVRRPAGQRQLA